MMKTIKAIIFDFGGVIAHFNNPEKVKKMSDQFGVSPEKFEPVYFKYRSPYDRGDRSCEEYWQLIGSDFGVDVDNKMAKELYELDLDRWSRFDEKMTSFIKESHRQMEKIAILSNMPDRFWYDLVDRYDWASLFHGVTISGIINVSKPEEAIYRHSLDQLGFDTEECLFIDDLEHNIKGAQKCGIQTIQYSGFDDFIKIFNDTYAPVTCG